VANSEGTLKPGMVAQAIINVQLEGTPLVVPNTAVIDTGVRKVVWLQYNERSYVAHVIETGFRSDGYVEVAKGLKEGDKVVIEGGFLLDAQAQFFGGYEDFIGGQTGKHSH
jgi:multidrug efflux pump subunit AcrA (membrane-fusion protein)